MHAFIEMDMGDKPALRPKAPIGPALQAIAAAILAHARAAIADPERPSEDTVHEFRRAMKQWRALMRLLGPFLADAARWRGEARDHARSLATARDGQSALNAFDDVAEDGLALSARSVATIRARLEAVRDGEEKAVLTPAPRPRRSIERSAPCGTPTAPQRCCPVPGKNRQTARGPKRQGYPHGLHHQYAGV